ncbi:MAG TPA: hypothetical protein VFT22_33590 [Kofleriaceae bacterium]|nr:hypothetical protein [Kofleriaceae bacterium]
MMAAAKMAEGGSPPYQAVGDVWTTSSGYSGRDYVAARTRTVDTGPPGKNHSAPSMVALDAAALQSGALGPSQWVVPPSSADDGLTVAADPGGPSLWLAATGGKIVGNHPAVALFPRCQRAVDDPATCPRASTIGTGGGIVDLMAGVTDRGRGSHTTVVVNPCTHHALVSFMENGARPPGAPADGSADFTARHSYVEVRAVDHGGRVVGSWELPIGFQGNDQGCQDAGATNPFNCTAGNIATLCPNPNATNANCCWHANTCMPASGSRSIVSRYYQRVQMDVKVSGQGAGATCTLYLGWDNAGDRGDPYEVPSTGMPTCSVDPGSRTSRFVLSTDPGARVHNGHICKLFKSALQLLTGGRPGRSVRGSFHWNANL